MNRVSTGNLGLSRVFADNRRELADKSRVFADMRRVFVDMGRVFVDMLVCVGWTRTP